MTLLPNHPTYRHCGLCSGPMETHRYNAARNAAVEMRTVELCRRCDLTPDPPVQIVRGSE